MPGGLFYYEETFFPMLVTLIVINKDPERAGQGAPDTASIPRGVRGEQNNKPYYEILGAAQFIMLEVYLLIGMSTFNFNCKECPVTSCYQHKQAGY